MGRCWPFPLLKWLPSVYFLFFLGRFFLHITLPPLGDKVDQHNAHAHTYRSGKTWSLLLLAPPPPFPFLLLSSPPPLHSRQEIRCRRTLFLLSCFHRRLSPRLPRPSFITLSLIHGGKSTSALLSLPAIWGRRGPPSKESQLMCPGRISDCRVGEGKKVHASGRAVGPRAAAPHRLPFFLSVRNMQYHIKIPAFLLYQHRGPSPNNIQRSSSEMYPYLLGGG